MSNVTVPAPSPARTCGLEAGIEFLMVKADWRLRAHTSLRHGELVVSRAGLVSGWGYSNGDRAAVERR